MLIDNKEVGKKLKHLRGNKSRDDVAKAVGISISALQMYENGERTPRDEIKVALAQYYGMSIEALFFK